MRLQWCNLRGQSSFVRSAAHQDFSPFRALRPAGPHEKSRAQGHVFEQLYAAVNSTDVFYDICDIFMMELSLRWAKQIVKRALGSLNLRRKECFFAHVHRQMHVGVGNKIEHAFKLSKLREHAESVR